MKQGYLSCFKNSSISSAVFTWKRRFEIWKATSVECCSGGVENCSIKPQSPAPAQGFCFRMCWTSTSEVLLLAGLWHKCQVTSSAGCIRNEGPCCHMCVLKLVPSIFLLLEDADCDYSSQERPTEISTSSWKEIKHKAATTPMHVVQWHLQRDC